MAACARKKHPSTFTPIIWRYARSSTSGKCSARAMPAMLPSTSSRPNRSTVGGDRRDALVAAADVAGTGLEARAGVGDELGGLAERVGVEVVCEHLCALTGEAQCDRPTDPRAGAGDERDLAVEACHACPSAADRTGCSDRRCPDSP